MHVCEHQLLLLPPPRPLAERLGREFFRQVPECPGVYLLCGAGDGVLYIGKAKNLRRRLGSYRSANPDRLSRKLRRLLATVERIHWDECADENAALEREAELLRSLRPRFNSAGVFPAPSEYLSWECRETEFVLRVTTARVATSGIGPLPRLGHAAVALARMSWRLLHRDVAWHEMPRQLLHGSRCEIRRIPFDAAEQGKARRLNEQLEMFRDGGLADFPERLLAEIGAVNPFETQWAAADAETLADLAQRIARQRRRGGNLASTSIS